MKSQMNVICLSLCLSCALLGAVTFAAADIQAIPEGGNVMTTADGWTSVHTFMVAKKSAAFEPVQVTGESFAEAMQISMYHRPEDQKRVAGFSMPVVGEIRKGDLCLLSFWARATHSENESGTSRLVALVELNKAPYTSALSMPCWAGKNWRRIDIPFVSLHDLAKDQIQISLHMGFGFCPQTIEIADVKFINYRDLLKLDQMPLTRISYEGRSEDAPWRKEALARIEKIRKAPMQIQVVDDKGEPISGASVHVQMKRHEFGFGAAVTAYDLCRQDADGEMFRKVVASSYNKVVLENDLKWGPWDISKSNDHRRYRQQWLDEAFSWLKAHQIQVRGHRIVSAPLTERDFQKWQDNPEGYRQKLFAHIDDEVHVVGQRVSEWDVVNHIVGWGHTIRDIFNGPQIYLDAINKARSVAPHATLWVNEGAILPNGNRRDAYEQVIQYLKQNNASPDGIGFMGHFSLESLTSPQELIQVFDRYAKLIPNLQITELDVGTINDEALQADYYRDVLIAAFSHPAMRGVIMWGFWEGNHWTPQRALYRKNWELKPAAKAWQDWVLNKWWTNEQGQTNEHGQCPCLGFRGDYQVQVSVMGQQKNVRVKLEQQGTEVRVVFPARQSH